jgi:hypothetical protein
MRLLLVVSALATCVPAWSESKLAYVDLRVQGGATVTTGAMGALTLMCGDIGDNSRHVVEMDQDVGIVIGIRGIGASVHAPIDGAPDLPLRLAGGEFLGGLGYLADAENHLELLAKYHMGVTAQTGDTRRFRRNGTYRGFGGELGWYHTWTSRIQFGLLAGYSVRTLRLDVPGGSRYSSRIDGIDASASLGYRF